MGAQSLTTPPPAGRGEAGRASAEDHLRLEELGKEYDGQRVVDRLSLGVRKGELLALLGPSGCGKSTTLRMIAGLVAPTRGRVHLSGRDLTDVPPHRRDLGLVFQNYALFPHLTVERNVAFGLEMRGLPRADVTRRVGEALELVRLNGFERRRPRSLSGGQQQRVALARALVIRPELLLLDEPLFNLDAKLRDDMRGEIRDIQSELGTTAVFVTHDQVEALTMCDRVAVMDRGRLAQLGSPVDVYERPATPFVAGFVGRINRLEGIIEHDGGSSSARVGGALLPVGFDAARAFDAGERVTLMLRPHRIDLAKAPNGGAPLQGSGAAPSLAGRIARVTYAGDVAQFDVRGDGFRLAVERRTDGADWAAFRADEPVVATWPAEATLVFPAAADEAKRPPSRKDR